MTKQERLEDIMVLACEKDLTDTVSVEKIIDQWKVLPKRGRVVDL